MNVPRKLAAAAAAVFLSGLTAVHAQNAGYAPGDLVLFFQNPGGTQGSEMQVFASLGDTATVFRQAFESGQNLTNVVNIQPILTGTFGTNWASATTLFAGLGGAWGTDPDITDLQNGDPHRTVYTSRARNSLGTVGSSNSLAVSIAGNTGMTQMAGAVEQQNNIFETGASTSPAAITNSLGATIASINPTDEFGGLSSWNNRIPAPGVQQRGSASTFGTFGSFTNVEFLLDLYRVQAVNDIPGQYGFGAPIRSGRFLGTVVLTADGNVSFVAAAGAVTPYAAWAAGYGLDPLLTVGPTAGHRDADPEADGITNIKEYAFGTDPTRGNRATIAGAKSGSNILVTMIQRNSGISSYVLQTRGEAGSGIWTNSGLTPVPSVDQDGVPVGYTRVVYTAVAGPGNSFFRALATE